MNNPHGEVSPDTSASDIERIRSHVASLIPVSHGSVITFATEALKAAALISGGSAAATMAFMGALLSARQYELASWLPWSLRMFVAALFCTCVATGLSYLAQLLYGWTLMSAKWALEPPPFHIPARHQGLKHLAGLAFQAGAVLAVVAAYLLVLVGYLAAYRAIVTVGFHPSPLEDLSR